MTLSWKRKSLEERARISARKDNANNRLYARRFILFGERVVPLETFILAQARSHQSFDKDRARLLTDIRTLHAGIRRRNESLAKAHFYIQALKAAAGLPLKGLTRLPQHPGPEAK